MSTGQNTFPQGLGVALRFAIAGLIAALAMVLGLCLAGVITSSGEARLVAGEDLVLQRGTGDVTANGFLVRGPGADNLVLILTPPLGVSAADYAQVSWETIGLRAEQEFQVVWTTSNAPGRAIVYQPTAAELEQSTANLGAHPAWAGRINNIGLLLRGPLHEPLLISSLGLASARGGCSGSVLKAAAAWSHRESWSQRSINFTLSREPSAFGVSPPLVLALWVALTTLITVVICRRCRVSSFAVGVLSLTVLAWFVLDLRWQGQLLARLTDSHQRYAELDDDSRPQAAPDGRLFKLVEALRTQLPSEPSRILIISDEVGGYLTGRTRYHLLPHRVHSNLVRLPSADEVAPGDYLFLMAPLQSVRYDLNRKTLNMNGTSLSVEPVWAAEGFGQLFRVREEG